MTSRYPTSSVGSFFPYHSTTLGGHGSRASLGAFRNFLPSSVHLKTKKNLSLDYLT